MTVKFKNECLFCESRCCTSRIQLCDFSYDEIACDRHGDDLISHSNNNIEKGKLRSHISGSGSMSRRNGENDTKEVVASLNIELNMECPLCMHYFNALSHDEDHVLLKDLLHHSGFNNASGNEVKCPQCEASLNIGEVEW